MMTVTGTHGCRAADTHSVTPDASAPTADAAPSRGDRHFAIDINMAADGDYDRAFDLAVAAGAGHVVFFQNWNGIETAPLTYDGSVLAIVNAYYPARKTPVHVTITPIHTNVNVMPADIADLPLNHPTVINRFAAMLDFALAQLPDVEIGSLVLGSEFDVTLGTDAKRWEEYIGFYAAVVARVRATHPKIRLAVEVVFPSLRGEMLAYIQQLANLGDILGVSYYPVDPLRPPTTVHADFASMVQAASGNPVYLYQIGYPSSTALGSSEAQQAEFYREMFRAWDAHAEAIPFLAISWLHDVSAETLQEFEQFYGVSDPNFLAFLGTLGLRSRQGVDKPAFTALQDEASRRGW